MANDLGSLIAAEVARAEGDHQGARARAMSVVGMSGGMVTLVAGLLAIAAGSKKDFLPHSARVTILVAVIAYVSAAAAALIVNIPAKVTVSEASALHAFAENNWDDDGWDQQVGILMASYLVSLRKVNRTAAGCLIAAIALEIAGIAATAIMALQVVNNLG